MPVITELSQLDLTKQYSYADYLTWQISERLELIKGWIMRMAAPSRVHQAVLRTLVSSFEAYFRDKAPCEYYFAPFDVRLPRKNNQDETILTVVQPDLCVICDPAKLDKRGCIGAPDLVVEILSPGNSRKEMKEKFEVYEENGVREYWIISTVEKNVLIFVLNEQQKFIGLRPHADNEILTSHIFPDLQVDLNEVFKNV